MKGIQLTDYDLAVKVERDSSGKILNGMVVGDVLHQNQAVILSIRKGELKENPSVGVGLADMLLEHDLAAIQNEIRQQLEMDGQKVSMVRVTHQEVIINAKY
ncbi:MAG: hypothetical protein IJ307_05875 [Bacteroidales bacterium]|nr:hypothetical protein [Bacteroidales bacterium]